MNVSLGNPQCTRSWVVILWRERPVKMRLQKIVLLSMRPNKKTENHMLVKQKQKPSHETGTQNKMGEDTNKAITSLLFILSLFPERVLFLNILQYQVDAWRGQSKGSTLQLPLLQKSIY